MKKILCNCSSCNSVYEISNNKGERIERGEDIEITYWDLKSIDGGFYKENCSPQNICANCGRVVENDFKYCPYCGQKIKL
ncbi:zinc-ribbon domain-containing protein [Haloimpatiens sp. FM7330]|uniref:zinc-ribbon domain-containing protein n=1 Tax=Haloimpatiens sp. FM7330 TaxID=3298610 RepID=UPI0036327609